MGSHIHSWGENVKMWGQNGVTWGFSFNMWLNVDHIWFNMGSHVVKILPHVKIWGQHVVTRGDMLSHMVTYLTTYGMPHNIHIGPHVFSWVFGRFHVNPWGKKHKTHGVHTLKTCVFDGVFS